MNSRITIRITKRSLAGWMLWLLIMMPFSFGTLNDLVGLPWAIRYLLDVAWLGLGAVITVCRWQTGNQKVSSLALWILLFLIYTLFVYIVQYQNAMYYLWGVRNNFRFYAALFLFASLLTLDDIHYYLNAFDILFWVNAVVSLFQFFVLELDGDFLGGLFGAEKGGNAYTNIFFLIVVTKSVVLYLGKQEKTGSCIAKCVTALLVAALAELKFFFVEFVLMIILAVLLTNFTWRKLWIIFGGMVAVVLGAALLTRLFPSFAGWFSVQWFLENALSDKGYTSSGDLNRLTAIPQINALWLRNTGLQLFGLGMGNCDTSTFSFLNTPFYLANEDMHYTWLSYAMMYLECGWVGLVFYVGFFVLLYHRTNIIKNHANGIVRSYCILSQILVVMCVLISIYNSSLRTEAAYMMYFILAIPFVLARTYKIVHKQEIMGKIFSERK